MVHNYSLELNNIAIRQLEESDIELLRAWRNNPDNSKYLRNIPYITEEMQKKWYKNYLKNNDEIAFAIVESQFIHGVVGSVSLYNFCGKRAEFGKILIGNEKAHGKKIGYTATLAVLKIAFEELELDEVVLECNNNNFPAIRVYEQAGFILSEIVHDIRHYSLTKQQFYKNSSAKNPSDND